MNSPVRSVFFRYFTHTATLVFLSFSILGVALVFSSSAVVNASYRAAHIQAAEEAAVLVSSHAVRNARDISGDFRQAMRSMTAVAQCEVALCDPSGEVFFITGGSSGLTTGTVLTEAALAAVRKGGLLPSGVPDAPDERYETFAYTAEDAYGDVLAYVLLTGDSLPAKTLTVSFLRIYLLTAAMVMLIAFGTAYVNSRALARPLHDMAVCARQFERGDFTARVNRWILRDDEIGELAASFNSMAEALEKSEELRRAFIGGVSHELKTPMTTISGYIGGLLDGTIPPEKQKDTLRLVRDEIMRLSRLVTGMLELSRHQSGQMDLTPRPTDIAELSTRILLGLEPKINQKGLSVEVTVPDEPLMILADPDGMVQVMTNLLDNAVKFCNPGGRISLGLSRRGGRAYVVIRNTGQTIAPQDMPYIFDQFHKGDRSRSLDRSGLGLGLYLVKSILNAHNEDIFAMSGNGETEFMFSLPESREERRH